MSQCPKCNTVLRPGARFCSSCGQVITGQPGAAPHPFSSAPPYSPPASGPGPGQAQALVQQAGQIAGKAAVAAAPVARAAGGAAWQASKKGMGWFARIVTLGGRAAYTEIFNPLPALEGQVMAPPALTQSPAPIEPAALVFVLSFLVMPLVFLIKDWGTQIAVFAALIALLLVANFGGLRWPALTKLTFGNLFGRYPGRRVDDLRFQIYDAQKGGVNVRVVGPRKENSVINTSHRVRVWGMPEPGRNEVRVWKIELYSADGQPLGIITAPRMLPLFAMLFAPVTLWFLIWLVVLIVHLAGK